MRSSSVARTSLFILCLSILMAAPGRWARAADPGFQEPDLDFELLEPEPDMSPLEFQTAEAGSCDGIGDGIWNGCRGTGCHVCQEKLVGYDCYFQRHPDCIKNTTCAGQFYSCDAACPPPSEADRCSTCDGIGDGIWNGCRGTGCHVCQEKLVGYDCYFQNHPQCIRNTTCAGQFYSCDSACPPPTAADRCSTGCQTDTCTSCARPALGLDYDLDSVPDTLEHDLAHKFFPRLLLQGFDDDLEESYFYNGLAMPYVVQPLSPRSICDEAMECLEIRYVLAYQEDTGDTIFGISSHQGDSEFYAVLLQRTTTWSSARENPAAWQMIRDFTAAHWTATGDSSRYGAYGHCAPYCRGYDGNELGCLANSTHCNWIPGSCMGSTGDNWQPCSFNWDEGSCFFAGGNCRWFGADCYPRTSLIVCDSFSPLTTNLTLYAAEGKHGTYHSKYECDNGGFLDADACPHNRYDLRQYKGLLLQNAGSLSYRTGFDETVQHPNFCNLYWIWSGVKFAESTDFKHHFTYNFSWALP